MVIDVIQMIDKVILFRNCIFMINVKGVAIG